MFKPMLAATVKDIESLPYPMIASPKLDGIRCVIQGGKALSRKLKEIPNRFVREQLASVPEGLDGELLVGDSFQAVTSGIMSHDGEPNFTYWVFDFFADAPYSHRLLMLDEKVLESRNARVEVVPTTTVNNVEELLAFEAECLDAGFEGVCLRTPDSPYKFGRSTLKEGWLLKLKRFVDAEAHILAVEEQFKNTNEATKDELGNTKRSKTIEGREGKNTMGRFHVKDCKSGVEFYVGTGEGLTDALRKEIWENRDSYLGRIITYKSQPFGAKDAPRLPIFKGFRED